MSKKIAANKTSVTQYWLGTILKRILDDILDYFKKEFGLTFLIIFGAIVASFLSLNGLLDNAIAAGYLADVSSLFRTIVAVLVLSVLYILWGIIYYPAKIDNEKKEQIDELEGLLSQELVKVKLKFQTYPRLAEFYASVKIFNRENKDLTKCYVKIEEVIATYYLDGHPVTQDQLESINPNNYFVSWAGGDEGEGRKTIEGKNHAVLNVAKLVSENRSWWFSFQLHKGDSDKSHWRMGDYKIRISLRGWLGEKQIQPEEYIFLMSLDVKKKSENSNEIFFHMKELKQHKAKNKTTKDKLSQPRQKPQKKGKN